MICVSLDEPDPRRLPGLLDGLELAEVRLDALTEIPRDLTPIFDRPTATVATMRPGRHDDELRSATLVAAIAAGATYVDVELDAPGELRARVLAAAHARGCRAIVSHHDHRRTPSRRELSRITAACFAAGADIAKVACLARTMAEAARLLGLLDDPRPVIPIGMGPAGRATRVVAPLLGAPFTYAAAAPGRETAPGQYAARDLATLLAGLGHG